MRGDSELADLSPADLLAKIQALPFLTVSDPQTVRYGGFTGREVAVTVNDAALAACSGPAGGGAKILHAGGEDWEATPGERFRLVVLDVRGLAVTIIVTTDWATTPSVQQLEAMNQRAQTIIDSIIF